MDLLAKRELNNGFGESLAKAFELVVTPGIFGFGGWLLDHRIGTTPLFTLVFTLAVFGYVCWKLWGSYERQMQAHESRLGMTRGGQGSPDPSDPQSPRTDRDVHR